MTDERLVISVVDEILRTSRRDEDQIVAVLRREVECFRNPTDDHAVWWNSSAWSDAGGWDLDTHDRVKTLGAWLRSRHPSGPDWVLVSRDDAFTRSGDSELDLFLAAMAWGFGDRGY